MMLDWRFPGVEVSLSRPARRKPQGRAVSGGRIDQSADDSGSSPGCRWPGRWLRREHQKAQRVRDASYNSVGDSGLKRKGRLLPFVGCFCDFVLS